VSGNDRQFTSWVHLFFSPAPSGAPERLTADVRSSHVVNISWQAPVEERQNGDIRQYRITLREIPTGRVWSLITITTSHLLDFLHPYYIYTIRVAAYTVAVGPYSESLQFITHEDGKIGSFSSSQSRLHVVARVHNIFMFSPSLSILALCYFDPY
jgi:hypothetical protein